MKCSKCNAEMKVEVLRIRNERPLLPEIMRIRRYTCVNKECERFNHPFTTRPLPAPRFPRGKDQLSERERERLGKLVKVALAPGLESTGFKVVDAVATYLLAALFVLSDICGGAANQAVRRYAGDVLKKMNEENRINVVSPRDIEVYDKRTQKSFKIQKSEWTKDDESKYVPPNYFVHRGIDYTPQWLIDRLRGDDLQAELLRLFRDYPRISVSNGPLLGSRGLIDTAEGIAIRLGRDQADVRCELDKLLERGILIKTEKMEYFAICPFPPKYPLCRICHQPMKLLDEEERKWCCNRDHQVWFGKEARWEGPTRDELRLARLPRGIVQASPQLLQQLAPDNQREIELTCRRLLQQVAMESEFEITSLKVVEAIETLEAAAIPALIEVANRATKPAVRNYAHDTLVRIMESRKEPKQTNPEQAILLNCPNCGGEIASGGQSRCEYCGVELILGERGFLPRSLTRCPECRDFMAGNAWFCVNCQQILTRNTTPLKEIQKRLLLEQENHRQLIGQKIPEIAEGLLPHEFIHSVYYWKFGRSRSYEVVTDRKLVHYAHAYAYASNRDLMREIPWNEFVRVTTPLAKKLPYDLLHRIGCYILPVQTLRGDCMITLQVVKHGFIHGDWEGCMKLYRTIKVAQNDFNTQKRNIKATICSLKL